MKKSSWVLLAIGLILVLLSLTRILGATQGLEITKIPDSDPPTTVITSSIRDDESPVVLIGHGFAGSELLMRGFSLPLANAGYAVVTWDFDGHGRNPNPYNQDRSSNGLLTNAENALETARTHGYVTADQVAILAACCGEMSRRYMRRKSSSVSYTARPKTSPPLPITTAYRGLASGGYRISMGWLSFSQRQGVAWKKSAASS